ncbi:MAG: carboxypeptidase regulatory-like domain-containing protein [Terriglobia bacterium]|nr:carboxypeptidase regulatory-like domain-containing protein [Terriglobia bacterium]
MQRYRVTGILLFICLFASFQLFAQTQATTGVIQGNVSDPSGAILPGASVEVRNTETNFTRQATTDDSGRFVFLALQPGPYTVTVSGKQGFATLVQENLNLTVGQAITLNLAMKVSQGSERVVVTDTPLVDAVKTESSSTLDQQAVEDTPTLGRKFEDFLTLTPGVSISQGPDGDEINFNGQRGIFNNISLDGGDYNNGFFGEQMGGQRAAIDITLDAVGEFQVVASGASAEFGRTAGGVVNVVTKSGTNDMHGSAFMFGRTEGLSSNTSDGKPLKDFHREQFGGTIGGPIKKDKMFFFGAFEQIFENLQRPNLSVQAGDTACPSTTPDLIGDSGLAANVDCQRLALLSYYKTALNDDESKPVPHTINNSATLAKWDWVVNTANKLSASYNFDYSKNKNQTFDVGTYGLSANGTEGPSKIQAINLNLFTTISADKLNEAHFTYGRENRPRQANDVFGADTGIGFGPSFRFGNPFFLQPNVDEIFWRTQAKDNFSIVKGRHNIKFGGEWIHSLNSQVFRGFFQGRYLFDSVVGFLRYTSPEALNGFGPSTAECGDGSWATYNMGQTCAGGVINGPLLLYLQGAALNGPATDATGASTFSNEDLALFAQDKWQVTRNFTLSYGLRWEAQTFPDPVTPPSQTPYGVFLNNPAFPSDGKLPSQWKEFQPRLGMAWDVGGKGKSVWRASAGIYNGRQNMLTQTSALTTNGVQQQTLTSGSWALACPVCYQPPTYPNVISSGIGPGLAPGVHVFDRNYKNPRIYSYNTQFEQEVARDVSVYVDFTWSKGEYLTTFYNWDRADRNLFTPTLGDLFVHGSNAHSDYKGGTFGIRKRMSHRFQMEANYVYSRDYDTDSNERDPFNDFSGPPLTGCGLDNLDACFPTYLDWAPSNRDARHKFNMYLTGKLPWAFDGNVRFQAHSAQPNAQPRTDTAPRNFGRKDNAYTSLDWRLSRDFHLSERVKLTPQVEMFNTFNSKNNVNTLSAPPLFDFNGFLRLGVGDPRETQLSVKLTF